MNANHHRRTFFSAALLAAGCLLVHPGAVRCEEGVARPDAENTRFPELPKLIPAKSKPVEGGQEPVVYWTKRGDAMIEAAGNIEDPIEKSRNLLGAANIILARQLEPFSSIAVLNLPPAPSDDDRKTISEALDRAERLITQASELLKTQIPHVEPPAEEEDAEQPKNDAPKSDAAQLLHAGEALQSFLNGQRVYLLGEIEPGARRRAASALAPLLEDSDRKVSSAARLWQALLRGLESDPTAALQILDSRMTPPHPETWPYGLFARVVRCRFEGVKGSWSPALVMLVQIEDQLEEWVPDVAHRGDARRLFAFTRLDVLRRWHDSLPPEQETERAWCARQAQEIVRSYFSVESSLLRLEPAIPMVFSDDVYKAGDKKPDPH